MFWDPFSALPAGRRLLWAILACIACILQGPAFIDSLRPAPDEGVDFFQDWASARNWKTGRPVYSDLEEAATRYFAERSLSAEHVDVQLRYNAHPPSAVLMALPLLQLSYPNAVLVWNVVSLAVFLLSLWLIAREVDLRPSYWGIFPFVTLWLLCNRKRPVYPW